MSASRPHLFGVLDDQWGVVATSASATARLRHWQADDEALRPFATLPELLAATEDREAPAAAKDAVLAALAGRAGSDELAARVLLQALLPGAKALARRLGWLGDPEDRAVQVVEAVCERIGTYPLERRPARVAANVLADASQRLMRASRDAGPEPQVVALEYLDEEELHFRAEPSAGEELLGLLAWAVRTGALGRSDARLIALTRVADVPPGDVGAAEGLGAHTMRRRRHRAEAALAGALARAS